MRKNTDSPTFLYARQRHAGPMHDKRNKNNPADDWKEEIEVMNLPRSNKEIDIRIPMDKFAKRELSISELGKEIAQIILNNEDFISHSRLPRIEFKFVETTEQFDACLNDLQYWCAYFDFDLIIS